ncbi:unnamed protein product [Diabrotica balteata]|uniref:Ig-like domain-containing protein n=1 Tax=Diabrotica balteata TaxID=107213 RepID=A0A9N9TCW5_DIABA|nr:unnamed protein product [Diabrotica balteata]
MRKKFQIPKENIEDSDIIDDLSENTECEECIINDVQYTTTNNITRSIEISNQILQNSTIDSTKSVVNEKPRNSNITTTEESDWFYFSDKDHVCESCVVKSTNLEENSTEKLYKVSVINEFKNNADTTTTQHARNYKEISTKLNPNSKKTQKKTGKTLDTKNIETTENISCEECGEDVDKYTNPSKDTEKLQTDINEKYNIAHIKIGMQTKSSKNITKTSSQKDTSTEIYYQTQNASVIVESTEPNFTSEKTGYTKHITQTPIKTSTFSESFRENTTLNETITSSKSNVYKSRVPTESEITTENATTEIKEQSEIPITPEKNAETSWKHTIATFQDTLSSVKRATETLPTNMKVLTEISPSTEILLGSVLTTKTKEVSIQEVTPSKEEETFSDELKLTEEIKTTTISLLTEESSTVHRIAEEMSSEMTTEPTVFHEVLNTTLEENTILSTESSYFYKATGEFESQMTTENATIELEEQSEISMTTGENVGISWKYLTATFQDTSEIPVTATVKTSAEVSTEMIPSKEVVVSSVVTTKTEEVSIQEVTPNKEEETISDELKLTEEIRTTTISLLTEESSTVHRIAEEMSSEIPTGPTVFHEIENVGISWKYPTATFQDTSEIPVTATVETSAEVSTEIIPSTEVISSVVTTKTEKVSIQEVTPSKEEETISDEVKLTKETNTTTNLIVTEESKSLHIVTEEISNEMTIENATTEQEEKSKLPIVSEVNIDITEKYTTETTILHEARSRSFSDILAPSGKETSTEVSADNITSGQIKVKEESKTKSTQKEIKETSKLEFSTTPEYKRPLKITSTQKQKSSILESTILTHTFSQETETTTIEATEGLTEIINLPCDDFLVTLTEISSASTPSTELSSEENIPMEIISAEENVDITEQVAESFSGAENLDATEEIQRDATKKNVNGKKIKNIMVYLNDSVTTPKPTKTIVIIVNNSGKRLHKLNETTLEKLVNKTIDEVNLEYIDLNNLSQEAEIQNGSENAELDIPDILKGDGKLCTKSEYNSSRYCPCDVDSYVKTLQTKIDNNTDTSTVSCPKMISFHDGFLITNKTEPLRRKKRSLLYMSNVGPNVLVYPNKKARIYCINEADRLLDSKDVTFKWEYTKDNEGKGELLPFSENPLVIQNADEKTTGNYTCTKIKNETFENYTHEMQLITFPVYKIKLEILYWINDSCSLQTGDILFAYLPKIIGPVLCGGNGRLCHVDIERPRCFNKEDNTYFKVSVTATMNDIYEILPTTDDDNCNLNCRFKAYTNIIYLVNKNAKIVRSIPIHSRLDTDLDFLTNMTTVTNKPSKLITTCRGGYGIEKFKQRVCVICPKHTFSPIDEAFCKVCPAGQYQPHLGSQGCIPCLSPLDDTMCLRMLVENTESGSEPDGYVSSSDEFVPSDTGYSDDLDYYKKTTNKMFSKKIHDAKRNIFS